MWLWDGDVNTQFFHQRATNKKKKNSLKGLKDKQGVWKTDEEEVEAIVLSYYTYLFKSSLPSHIE